MAFAGQGGPSEPGVAMTIRPAGGQLFVRSRVSGLCAPHRAGRGMVRTCHLTRVGRRRPLRGHRVLGGLGVQPSAAGRWVVPAPDGSG